MSFTVLGTTGPAGAPAFISDDLGRTASPVKAGYAYALGAGRTIQRTGLTHRLTHHPGRFKPSAWSIRRRQTRITP